MSFKQTVTVLGVKRSQGVMDNGKAFDSTKAFIALDMDGRKGDAVGQSCEPFTIGTSSVFEQWKGQKFPLLAEAEMDLVTSGKAAQMVVISLVPQNKAVQVKG